MFGFLKKVLQKPSRSREAAHGPVPATSHNISAATVTGSGSGSPTRSNLVAQPAKGIPVPLQPILSGLPLELQPLVVKNSVGALTVPVPLEKILAQLSRGVVKVAFGDLRQWAPEVFAPQADRDRVMVPLPLNEILPRISPALIQRRRAQRHVQVPNEISSPFDAQGNILNLAAEKNEPAVHLPEPTPAVPLRETAPPAPAPTAEPGLIPFKPAQSDAVAKANGSSNGGHPPVNGVPPHRLSLASAPTPQPPAGPEIQIPTPAPSRIPMPPPQSEPVAATAAPVAPPRNGNGHETLLVSLASIAGEWPDSIRREIVEQNLADAQVALPMEALDHSLKQGKIVFRWKSLRSWIKPSPAEGNSPQDKLALELPLRLVAPLYLERQKQKQKAQQKISIDEDIPNLFFGFPQADAEGAANGAKPGTSPGAKPVDTNYYVWDDGAEMVRVDESSIKRASAETRFVEKYATPNEVVSRAAALDGVAGALIALPDGLMVASQLPADVNGDTLAAFLPQIFGKVSACTKELRMGDLNNINFTVGNVPWKIFRVNAIFFAAFGRAGQALPSTDLVSLASELDHKGK